MRKIFVLTCIAICCLVVTTTIFQTSQIQYQLPARLQFQALTTPAKKQIECLAENIYFEASHEPKEGQVAVALVTLNRVSSGNYARDICGVVKQKTGHLCQFSWVCMPNYAEKRLTIKDTPLYNEILNLAMTVVFNYGNLKDSTNGATYYHADYVNPEWKLAKTTKIGRHIFYKKQNDVQNIKKEIAL